MKLKWCDLPMLLSVLGGPLFAAAGAAQPAATDSVLPPPPPYQVLRFEEDWRAYGAGRELDGLDRLKFVPLNGSGTAYLSVGGQLRYRSEAVSGFMLVDGDDREDLFGLTRAMAHADLRLGSNLRFFAEGRHSVAHGRDLPGGRRSLDHDRLDLHNGFVEVTGSVGGGRLTARAGRQELLLGAQRLVSPLDWANTRRTFDGARVQLRGRGLTAEAFWARPVVVKNDAFNRWDEGSDFAGAALSGGGAASWMVYALRLDQSGPVTFAGIEGAHERTTVGGRVLTGSPARVRAELEGGAQFGELGSQDIRAWFLASDFSHQLSGLPWRPTATVGVDWASGDGGPGGSSGTFHQLFPLGHAYVGFTDVLGRQNLIEARAVLTAAVTSSLQLRAAAHRFYRASTSDHVYNVGGAILESADGRSDRGIGHELDLTGALRVGRHTRVEAGYGRLVPGPFIAGRPTGAATMNWGFAGATFTF